MTTESTLPEEISFSSSDASISALLEHLHRIEDLGALMSLAEWDQQTYMPRGAGEVRMHQATTLQGIIHQHLTDPKLGILLDKLEPAIAQPRFSDADRGLVRKARRAYDHATKLPRE